MQSILSKIAAMGTISSKMYMENHFNENIYLYMLLIMLLTGILIYIDKIKDEIITTKDDSI